ncbi:hypothetical protein [Streptomyces sp. DH37]|uniref:hypothetical protein n=1 Tax=Streptomyces sp. DH37 TaxID=3040122 RepID=UPI0024429926|nr:hypothetical protein [Streptomyces sp. DH37]MDG9701682.1 hypothetical protein [Streptomyces sp. DH37]
MSTWAQERRLNQAAEAEERRRDKAFAAKLAREERRAAREEERAEKAQRRRDKAQRKAARAQRREKQLTPANVYRKGTLALVAASAAAALPAQIAYFVKKSLMLLPVPFALEGAAWVMAAGVAYADEKKLPAWVRWLLRGFCVAAAAFAARINYIHGAETSALVGWGLAAVTMLGPLFFEVRQWVMTLSAATGDPRKRAEEKKRARHERKRRRDHRTVAKVADRLVSAAPYGSLTFEDAWAQAWLIVHGTAEPGMTPKLHAYAARSAVALAAAKAGEEPTKDEVRERIEARLNASGFVLPTPPGKAAPRIKKPQVATDLPPSSKSPSEKPKKAGRRQPPPHRRTKNDSVPFHPIAKAVAADTARKHLVVNGHHH